MHFGQNFPPPLSPAAAWRRGFAFRDDKLYYFEPRSVLVMRLWPDMRAWRRTPRTGWAHTRKHADEVLCRAPLRPGLIEHLHKRRSALVGPLSPDQYADFHFRDSGAWFRAMGTVPERERAIVARFKDRRWHLLAMMARCPGAADLLDANPALGFAQANSWILHEPAVRQPMRATRALLRHKQERIQDWLGFPATERVRRILRKIDPGALRARLLPQLRRGLWDEEVTALLAHLPRISEEVLRWTLWDDSRRVATAAFLHELASVPAFDPEVQADREPLSAIGDARGMPALRVSSEMKPLEPTLETPAPHLQMWRDGAVKTEWLGRPMPERLRSVLQLRRWHASLEDAIMRQRRAHAVVDPDMPWASPPWPGTADIQPLATASSLNEEGRVMEHCVSTYADWVARGDYAVYRVLEPTRATLGVRRCGQDWVLDQLQGTRAAPLDPDMVAHILGSLDWLAVGTSGADA